MVCLVAQEHSAGYSISATAAVTAPQPQPEQLTMDHSLVDEQVRLGQMTPCRRPALTLQKRHHQGAWYAEPGHARYLELEDRSPATSSALLHGLTRELPDRLH